MKEQRVIFTRKIESELLSWKNSLNRKPIVLRGARQVGKTFVVNRFAENFDHFIGINLERPQERDLFSGFNTGQELVERILLYKGQKIDTKRALLFIDEIQHSTVAVQSLRYLYEDVKDLHVIAAGSLLSARLSLIIAASMIALDLGIINEAMNSAIILVAIITVVFAPMLFSSLIPIPISQQSRREKGENALKRLLTIIDDMGEEIHEDDLTAMFENIDVNHDGQIDIHELVAIFEGDLHVGEDDIL